jgi:hypothetical protein
MLMQNAIAKMIQRPGEANAGLEVCISGFQLPATFYVVSAFQHFSITSRRHA